MDYKIYSKLLKILQKILQNLYSGSVMRWRTWSQRKSLYFHWYWQFWLFFCWQDSCQLARWASICTKFSGSRFVAERKIMIFDDHQTWRLIIFIDPFNLINWILQTYKINLWVSRKALWTIYNRLANSLHQQIATNRSRTVAWWGAWQNWPWTNQSIYLKRIIRFLNGLFTSWEPQVENQRMLC